MKKTWLLIGAIGVLLAVVMIMIANSDSQKRPVVAQDTHDSHPPIQTPTVKTLPSHYTEAPHRASLRPTLEPERFTGLVRDAYRAVRESPQTIAQMPCYCYCDRGMGHKSLYSCFEDDHASHCAVCVNEALLAHKLDKEGKLTPAQIRDRIVQQFGQQN
ncbi:MAG: PCYCGC domain-containing protein [Acidobacteria bacterium]|nr:PCYCGC domain-containing protein [Acidobacteriota bacterium]